MQPAPDAPSHNGLTAVRRGLLAGLAALIVMGQPPSFALFQSPARPAPQVEHTPIAEFGTASASAGVRQLANGIARTQDHQGRAFFVIDKAHATLYAFDPAAQLQASTPVLLGLAPGDDSVPGIGNRPMHEILPVERTTPAGRFVAESGHNLRGEDVVWVDHGAAISMHRVRTDNPHESRAQRLATPTTDDNRISYGCINVPPAFYEQHVRPAVANGQTVIVYVMPQTRPLHAQFGFVAAMVEPPTALDITAGGEGTPAQP